MELDKKEVILDSMGRTVSVTVVDNYSDVLGNIVALEVANSPKKVKTPQGYVNETALENMRKIISYKEAASTNALESAKVFEPSLEVEQEEIKEAIVEKEEIKEQEEKPKRYSFEEEVVELPKEEKEEPQQATIYQYQEKKTEPRLSYDNFYNNVTIDPVEKLRRDLASADLTTISGKVLSLGVKKLNKYDKLEKDVNDAINEIDSAIKELEAKKVIKVEEQEKIRKEKANDVKNVTAALAQANQIDAFNKNIEENKAKRAREEEARIAKEKEQERLEQEKLDQMMLRIPSELLEEEPKKVVAFEETEGNKENIETGVSKTIDIRSKIEALESEVDYNHYDFNSLRKEFGRVA